MKEIPRLQSIINCAKVIENYRDKKGKLVWCWFDPKVTKNIIFVRNQINAEELRMVSRIYYDKDDKIIFTEVF